MGKSKYSSQRGCTRRRVQCHGVALPVALSRLFARVGACAAWSKSFVHSPLVLGVFLVSEVWEVSLGSAVLVLALPLVLAAVVSEVPSCAPPGAVVCRLMAPLLPLLWAALRCRRPWRALSMVGGWWWWGCMVVLCCALSLSTSHSSYYSCCLLAGGWCGGRRDGMGWVAVECSRGWSQ